MHTTQETNITHCEELFQELQMASTLTVLLLMTIFSSFQLIMFVSSFEFQAGDNIGWVVPPANDSKFYNDWASEKRFRAGDTIRFKYRKDSVMEVNETDYKKCNSTRPNFFSNTGSTIFTLDRSGYFYFISGASGHCERGQRMIVRVMAQDQDSMAGGDGTSSGSKATVLSYKASLAFVTLQFAFVYLVSYFF